MSRVVGVDVLGVASVGRGEERSGVDAVVLGRVTDDAVAAAGGEAVLAVDLVLTTVGSAGAGPDINVGLAVLPVGGYEGRSLACVPYSSITYI